MQEVGYYPINIKIEAALANQSNKEKKCQNSKLKSLNKDVFDIFYEDFIDFKNYINNILKKSFKIFIYKKSWRATTTKLWQYNK